MDNTPAEEAAEASFDAVVVNDDVERVVDELEALLSSPRN